MLHDYTAIDAGTIRRATDETLTAANELIDAATSGPATYDGVIARLDRAMELLAEAYGSGPFLARAHPDADVRDMASACEEELDKWSSSVVFRRDVYDAVEAFAATPEAEALGGERGRSLAMWRRDLRRAGHHLDEDRRRELEGLQQRLIELQVAFGRNLAEWEDHIDVPAERLAGMSDDYIERLEPGTEPGTYRITMAYPDYLPYMDEGADRELRRQLQHRFWNRAADENTALLAEAVEIRASMAALLGKRTWAEHAMEVKMADPEAVGAFYGRLTDPLTRRGREELHELAALAAADGVDEVRSWDWAYYDTLQRKRDYGIDPTEVAAYFPLDRVMEGILSITGDVFGLEYRTVDDPRAWHPDVTAYEVVDAAGGETIGWFYADLFPREGKFGHAACFPLAPGGLDPDGHRRRPVAAVLANFTKPTDEAPSLLKHDEAVTLFHEFGHVLHHLLARPELARFGAFGAEWDFVEAPSQIMENWMWEPGVLQRFAAHHETGAPIPPDLVERLVAARDQNVALKTLRQIFLGELDLALHASERPPNPNDAYRSTWDRTLLPFHEGTHFPAGFGHLMGGYDAGYYGYLWAKVFGDDMFSMFTAEGILDPRVGGRYRREILEPGSSRDAIDHLRAFLGRDPDPGFFLRRIGIDVT